jgi:hypothetical protein
MKRHGNTPIEDQRANDLSQVSKYRTQLQTVHDVLEQEPMTTWMVEVRTGIRREYVCGYTKKLRLQRKIQLLYKARCGVSGRKAGYYTTNTTLFSSHDNQLSLNLEGGSQ